MKKRTIGAMRRWNIHDDGDLYGQGARGFLVVVVGVQRGRKSSRFCTVGSIEVATMNKAMRPIATVTGIATI